LWPSTKPAFEFGKECDVVRRIARSREHVAKTTDSSWLLRVRGDRPCRRSTDQRNEFAPFQLIELHPLPPTKPTV
jgi:hypothetical protein